MTKRKSQNVDYLWCFEPGAGHEILKAFSDTIMRMAAEITDKYNRWLRGLFR